MVRLTLLAALATSSAAYAAPASSKTCTVKHTEGQDDTPHILDAFSKCSKDATIIFKEGIDYNAWTPAQLDGLSNVKILVQGNIHLPNSISIVQAKMNSTTNPENRYSTPWFYFQGDHVEIAGSKKRNWGQFQSYGQQWWDIGNRTLRPQLATFNVTNGVLRDLKVIKPIAWGWNIPGQNIRIYNHFVDAAPTNATRDDSISFPFNSDGFNFSGQNITLDGYYGHNGDDCVSVVHGAKNIIARNGYCGFASHGLSIGSLGRDGHESSVENVLFENWIMDGAVYGGRFKSWTGGRGLAKDITWRNIFTYNVSTPIFITQNYYDQDKGPRPPNTNQTSTRIENIRFENFAGYLNPSWTDGTCITDPCWNYVEGVEAATNGVIFDLYNGTATGLQVRNLLVHPYKKGFSATTVICDPTTLAPGEEGTLGFECVRGPFRRTPIQ